MLAVFAATGWLYLLRSGGVLGWGPHVRGSLPLEQLAGDDDQPLARLLAAWAPAGGLAGAALAAAGLGRAARAAAVGASALVALMLAGALSDAVSISESFASHLPAQPGRPGTWVAAALMGAAATLPRARDRAAAPNGP